MERNLRQEIPESWCDEVEGIELPTTDVDTTPSNFKSGVAEQVPQAAEGELNCVVVKTEAVESVDSQDVPFNATGNVESADLPAGEAERCKATDIYVVVADDTQPAENAVEDADKTQLVKNDVVNADGAQPVENAGMGADVTSAIDDDADGAEADGNTCAICLEQIPAPDLSMVKDCEHVYCVYCILKWATCKETAWCPQCKSPFSYLYCYRHLDGTLSDFAIEESVTLLKRAQWFQDRVKTEEKGKKLCDEDAAVTAVSTAEDWFQEFYEDFDDGHEDEEMEEFYFSRAAGHARIVIANRRWGEGGYMRSGRLYATPTSGGSSHGKAKSKGLGKSGKAQLNHVYSSSPPAPSFMGTSPSSALGTSPSGSGSGCSSGKPGRRAKRNAKRVAADAAIQG